MTTTVEARVVADLPDADYHSDPAMSSTQARQILTMPLARFDHLRRNPEPATGAMELGSAAHKRVLGVGADIVDMGEADWNTKAIKAEVAAVRARGAIPLKTPDVERIDAMEQALRAHPTANALLANGEPEQSVFWHDPTHGVDRRARLDWNRKTRSGRPIVVDYKTTVCACEECFAKSIANYGYDQQGAWYLDGGEAAGLDDPAFVLIAQEKTEPFLVATYQLDENALRIGHGKNQRALELWASHTASGEWPGYPHEIQTISLPYWDERKNEAYL